MGATASLKVVGATGEPCHIDLSMAGVAPSLIQFYCGGSVQSTNPRGSGDLPNLDLLRSIAVSLVVVEHTLISMRILWIHGWEIQWLGVVGVFMFFVHTSLVLMWSLERNPQVLSFYIRRAFRIYPLAIAAILAIVIFHIPTLQNPLGETFFKAPPVMTIVSNMLLVQNLAWGGNILGVMWTLPLEMDMYFLLPFLFFYLRQNFSVWPLIALWIASAEYARVSIPSNSSTFLVCIPYFLSGVVAYVLFSRVRPFLPAFLMPCFILVLLCGFMAIPSWHMGWLMTLVLGLGLPQFKQIRAKWLIRASHQVAKYSYGIYLAHLFSISVGVNLMHEHSLPIRIAVLVLSLSGIVVVSYHFLEKPLIDFGASLAKKMDKARSSVSVTT